MYYIGIDLGGTNIACGVVDDSCKIIYKDSVPTNVSRPAEEIIKSMALLAADAAEKSEVGKNSVAWVGIGSPGSIDRENGILLYANNLPFSRTPMREIFNKYWNIPVYIDNDANAAALGEAYAGAAKDCNEAIMITLGTGVGGGIIIDKKIYSGFNSNGAELGHMVIVANGEKCSCGRNGCWEAYASVTGLIRDTKKAMDAHPESFMWSIMEGSEKKRVSGRTS
ncbi:MAG: ROK family protein, partial [Clostridiales bacterium]|nr:ROK family protein [Clostridiales bacterium]